MCECGVETALIQEIKGPQVPKHRPVIFPVRSGVPYKSPVPISARDGVKRVVGATAGHVDALARRGRGPSTRLRVLEVEKPNAGDSGAALD